MDEAPIDSFAEQVGPWILHFGQLDIQPLFHGAAGQCEHSEAGRALQQELQGYVVFLHGSIPL